MRTKEFYDHNHAERYLTSSIIRIKDKPIWISSTQVADDGFVLKYKHLPLENSNRGYQYTLHSRSHVDMNPVSLGMLAIHKEDKLVGSLYVSRIPLRAWKIGLTEGNVSMQPTCDKLFPQYSVRDLFYSKAFVNTVLGKYPSIKEAIKLSFDRQLPIAFTRRFAVDGGKLLYKALGCPVGWIKDNEPYLSENFQHLSQVLKEDYHE